MQPSARAGALDAERAALRHAEALTRVADTDRDAVFQRVHDELAEGAMPGPVD